MVSIATNTTSENHYTIHCTLDASKAHIPNNGSNNTITIVFGVIASVLAVVGLAITYFRLQHSQTSTPMADAIGSKQKVARNGLEGQQPSSIKFGTKRNVNVSVHSTHSVDYARPC